MPNYMDWGIHEALRITGDLSLGMWVKLPSNAAGCFLRLGGEGTLTPTSAWPYFLAIKGSSDNWTIITGHDTSTSNINNAGSPFPAAIKNDQWTYIGITRQIAAHKYTMYKSLDAKTIATVGSFTYGSSDDPPSTAGTGWALWVASPNHYRDDLSLNPLIGTIDDMYIAAALWTPSQHLAAAKGYPSTTGLRLWCRMAEGPDVAVDKSEVGGLTAVVTGTKIVDGH